MIGLEIAEKLAVVGIDSSCAVAVRDLDRAAGCFQDEDLVGVVKQMSDSCPDPEASEQLASSFDTAADSRAVVVVAGPVVDRGCSDLPHLASDSYFRCLPCQVGVDCTVPGASLE